MFILCSLCVLEKFIRCVFLLYKEITNSVLKLKYAFLDKLLKKIIYVNLDGVHELS